MFMKNALREAVLSGQFKIVCITGGAVYYREMWITSSLESRRVFLEARICSYCPASNKEYLSVLDQKSA